MAGLFFWLKQQSINGILTNGFINSKLVFKLSLMCTQIYISFFVYLKYSSTKKSEMVL